MSAIDTTPTARTLFSPRLRWFIWVVIGMSAIGTVVAILVGSRFVAPDATQRDSYTEGPIGHRAFTEVMGELGVEVVHDRRGRYETIVSPLMIIEPNGNHIEVDGEELELGEVLRQRSIAGRETIVVLPKWRLSYDGVAEPDPEANALLQHILPGASLVHTGEPDDEMERGRAIGILGTYEVEIPWPQGLDTPADVPLLEMNGQALIVERDDGVIVVADPDLLHSWNIHRAGHASLFHDLITHELGSSIVTIDEVFHGHGLRLSLPMALGEWPAVLLTAHTLFLILLLVLLGARRFGRAIEERPLGRGPAESIAVSAFVLAEGRPIGTLANSYVREQLTDLAERLGFPPNKDVAAQAAHVDTVAKRRGVAPEAAQLLSAAFELSTKKKKNRKDALMLARRAHAFRERLLH